MRALNLILENKAVNYVNAKDSLTFNYTNADNDITFGKISAVTDWALGGLNIQVQQWIDSVFLNWMRRLDLNSIQASDEMKQCFAKPIRDYLIDCHFLWAHESSWSHNKPKQINAHKWSVEVIQGLPEWARNGWVLLPWGWDSFMEATGDEPEALFGGVPLTDSYEVFDFLNAQVLNNGRIERMSVPDAFRLSAEWHKQNSKVVLDDKQGVDHTLVADLGNGYKVVRVISTKGLDYESHHMQHCVGKGGYDHRLNGHDCILSVRDSQNIPHATIECRLTDNPNPFNYAPVEQIKGLKNGAVDKTLWPALQSFMIQNKFAIRRDARNIGLEQKP